MIAIALAILGRSQEMRNTESSLGARRAKRQDFHSGLAGKIGV
jgi:hypothetical protein